MRKRYPDAQGWTHKEVNQLIENKDNTFFFKTSYLCNYEQHQQCKQNGICMQYWRDGRMFKEKQLAEELGIEVENLDHVHEIVACELEEETLKKCRAILFRMEPSNDQEVFTRPPGVRSHPLPDRRDNERLQL